MTRRFPPGPALFFHRPARHLRRGPGDAGGLPGRPRPPDPRALRRRALAAAGPGLRQPVRDVRRRADRPGGASSANWCGWAIAKTTACPAAAPSPWRRASPRCAPGPSPSGTARKPEQQLRVRFGDDTLGRRHRPRRPARRSPSAGSTRCSSAASTRPGGARTGVLVRLDEIPPLLRNGPDRHRGPALLRAPRHQYPGPGALRFTPTCAPARRCRGPRPSPSSW